MTSSARLGQLAAACLALNASTSVAQDARFFRIAGPVATTITDVAPEGTVTWTNVATNTTFTVQTATVLQDPSNWVDWVQVPASDAVTVHRVFDPAPPSGMVLIPAGSFTMGDTLDGIYDATPTVMATISAFYMDRTEVTWSQWQSVYFWATNAGYSFVHAGDGKGPDHPVHSLNWYDCVKWCNARSEQAGLTPVYYTDAGLTNVYTSGQVAVYPDWTAAGYRLPTEAEWEKAARGGLSGQRFPWGNLIDQNLANYYGDTNLYPYDLGPDGLHPRGSAGSTYPDNTPYTTPVGTFAANGYGLSDMAGNMFEWCWDRYGTPYAGGSDPRGPATGSDRVLRGGRWLSDARFCRTANRFNGFPSSSFILYGGLRCVRLPGQ